MVCCSRSAEDCIVDGCGQRDTVLAALEVVRVAAGVDMPGLLGLLSEDLRVSAMEQGIAVLYGQRLCVVRREGGRWPFAVVQRKRNGAWMCHACPQGPGTCTHAGAARETGDNEPSEASGVDAVIRALGRRQTARSNTIYSTEPRPLVLTMRSQEKHAAVLRAAASGSSITLPAPATCSICQDACPDDTLLRCHEGDVEYGEGSVRMVVWRWRCRPCQRSCVADGLSEGLVLSSQYTAYTEVFLFEAAVSLCRNASSWTSTFELRTALHQMSKEHTAPLSVDRLRSLPGFLITMLL